MVTYTLLIGMMTLRLAWYGADARALAVEARGPAFTFGRATDVNFSAHPVISQDL